MLTKKIGIVIKFSALESRSRLHYGASLIGSNISFDNPVNNIVKYIWLRIQVKPGFTTYQPQPNNSRALSKMKKKQQKAIKNNKTNIILIDSQKEP